MRPGMLLALMLAARPVAPLPNPPLFRLLYGMASWQWSMLASLRVIVWEGRVHKGIELQPGAKPWKDQEDSI
eukprot:scaffold213559_cov21-Tisochrysis_lutea.AAC.1